MIHFSLFSGIGGFELAAEWMGWRNLLSCDINEFGNNVRKYYWPDVYCHTDIKTLNYETINNELSDRFGSVWRDDDIIITGGFPCQPYSMAGKRLGKDDERHLWPEMLRVIREVKPTWIVGENVHGLVNWNGGVVFNEVQTDLENEGYEVQAFVLPAASVNAPHRRDRVWVVAYSEGSRSPVSKLGEKRSNEQIQAGCNINGYEGLGDAANPDRNGLNERNGKYEKQPSEGREYALNDIEQISIDTKCIGRAKIRNDNGQFEKTQQSECGKQQFSRANCPQNWWRNFPSQSPVCGRDDGLPTELDGITFPKWRNESIKAYGNAVVPQVVYQIFKTIQQYEHTPIK